MNNIKQIKLGRLFNKDRESMDIMDDKVVLTLCARRRWRGVSQNTTYSTTIIVVLLNTNSTPLRPSNQ